VSEKPVFAGLRLICAALAPAITMTAPTTERAMLVRLNPNSLPTKQDYNTSSDSEHSQYSTDGWNWNLDHFQ